MTPTRGNQATRVLRDIERDSGYGSTILRPTVGYSHQCGGAARDILCTFDRVREGTKANGDWPDSHSGVDQDETVQTRVWT